MFQQDIHILLSAQTTHSFGCVIGLKSRYNIKSSGGADFYIVIERWQLAEQISVPPPK